MYNPIYSKPKNLINLFSVCADIDKISGQTDDFLDLLDDSTTSNSDNFIDNDIELDDDDLSSAAGGIAPINLPKEE